MSDIEILRLCKVLHSSGLWSLAESDIDFARAWDKGPMAITQELLSKALHPDPMPARVLSI